MAYSWTPSSCVLTRTISIRMVSKFSSPIFTTTTSDQKDHHPIFIIVSRNERKVGKKTSLECCNESSLFTRLLFGWNGLVKFKAPLAGTENKRLSRRWKLWKTTQKLRKKLVFFIAFSPLLSDCVDYNDNHNNKKKEEKLGKREMLYDVSYRRWQSARAQLSNFDEWTFGLMTRLWPPPSCSSLKISNLAGNLVDLLLLNCARLKTKQKKNKNNHFRLLAEHMFFYYYGSV